MIENKRLLPGSLSDADALTCNDPVTALMARLSVSLAHDALTDFLNAEIVRPGATADDILIGVAAYMMQIHASFAAYFVPADRADDVVEQYHAVFDRTYRLHFVDSAKELAA